MGCEKGLGERKRRLGCVFLMLLRPLRDLAYCPFIGGSFCGEGWYGTWRRTSSLPQSLLIDRAALDCGAD